MWEIISGVLGILGFIISSVNLFFFFIARKKKLSVCVKRYNINKDYSDLLTAHIRFDNLSEMPVSITQVRLKVNDEYFDTSPYPMVAIESKTKCNDKVIHDFTITTHTGVINLNPLESADKYLAFQIPQGSLSTDEKSLSFEICTNRGKKVQKTFVLCEDTLCR